MDANYLNLKLGPNTFDFESTQNVIELLGTIDAFQITLDAIVNLTESEQNTCIKKHKRLQATQQHFQNMSFAMLLKDEQKRNLKPNSCRAVADFGQNFEVGHKLAESEQTYRKHIQVTNMAVCIEYRLGHAPMRTLYVLVFSEELTHSSFNAVRYVLAAFQSELFAPILAQMEHIEFWTDRASHFCSREFCTFVLRDIPRLCSRNLKFLCHNFSAAHHGKDIADNCVRIGSRCIQRLNETETGYQRPKEQMAELQNILADQRNANVLFIGETATNIDIRFVWCETVPQTRTYHVLPLEYLDSSHCRKVKKLRNGSFQITEHFRYDNKIGILIPDKLITLKRPPTDTVVPDPIAPDEDGMCSLETHNKRLRTRNSVFKSIAKRRKVDMKVLLQNTTPASIDYQNVSILAPLILIAEPIRERRVGSEVWTRQRAIAVIKRVAKSQNTGNRWPTYDEFRFCKEGYLWKKLHAKSKWLDFSLKDWREACNLTEQDPYKSKKRKRSDPAINSEPRRSLRRL